MKNILVIFAIAFLPGSVMGQSKKEKQVATAIQDLRKAIVDADSVVLSRLTLPSLSYGHSSGKIETKQEFISSLTSGRSDFVTIDLSEQWISVEGKTAISRNTFIAATNDGGRPGTVKLHILLVWQKKGGSWKLLARQAARLQ
jgi:ketosteroid isomerase-like protein